MKRTWKPMAAGILDMVVGLYLPFPSALFLIPLFFPVDHEGRARAPLGLVWLAFSIPALLGGILTLRRRIWGFALTSSAMLFALFAVMVPLADFRLGVYMLFFTTGGVIPHRLLEFLFAAALLVPTVLIAVSKEEFA